MEKDMKLTMDRKGCSVVTLTQLQILREVARKVGIPRIYSLLGEPIIRVVMPRYKLYQHYTHSPRTTFKQCNWQGALALPPAAQSYYFNTVLMSAS